MSTRNVKRCLAVSAFVIASATVASNAAAAPVDNPGSFELGPTGPVPLIDFPAYSLGANAPAAIFVDLDASGAIDPSTSGAFFPAESTTLSGTPFAQLSVADGDITGTIDAAAGVAVISLRGQVTFTSTSYTCRTGAFTVTLSSPFPQGRFGKINDITVSGDVVIPPVQVNTRTGCSAAAAALLNSDLGLNGSATSHISLYKFISDRTITGS